MECLVDSGVVHFPWLAEASLLNQSSPVQCPGEISVTNLPVGAKFPRRGSRLRFTTQDFHHCAIKKQVAEADRPLLSTADLTAAGSKVEVADDGGKVVNKVTGKEIKIERRGNAYILRMWVEGNEQPVFTRQGS